MDEIEILAVDPIDAVRKAAGLDVPGPWWRVVGDDVDCLVKARTAEEAKAFVGYDNPNRSDVLLAHQV